MNWESAEIGSLCEVGRGSSPRPINNQAYFEGGDIAWIKIADATSSGKEIFETKEHVNAYGASFSRLLPIGSLILATSGVSLGQVKFLGIEGCIHDGWLYIKNYNGVVKEFLYYKLIELEKHFHSESYGAAIQNINTDILRRTKILLPPLETQKRIASILSNYDDLIENNLKRIKLLEETAQNIYKEWFVNFRFPNYEHTEFDAESSLPVGWSVDIIGNQLLTIKRNGKLKTDDYELEGKFPIIDQANGFIAGYTNNEEVVQDLHLPIVVFGDHTRRVKFVNFPFVSGADGTQLMFPKNENLLPAYFYLSINNIDLSNYAYARHYKFMKEQPIIIPDEKTLDEFNKKAYPLLEQTIHLLNYNQKLKEARDILLPRLMNRTIAV